MRITIKLLQDRLETLNSMADTLGINRYALYQAYDTVSLHKTYPGSGVDDVSSARGNREVYYLITGLIIGMSEATKALRP